MVNSKPVMCISEITSIVIPCSVDKYKLKCNLTYAVGCKCGL